MLKKSTKRSKGERDLPGFDTFTLMSFFILLQILRNGDARKEFNFEESNHGSLIKPAIAQSSMWGLGRHIQGKVSK